MKCRRALNRRRHRASSISEKKARSIQGRLCYRGGPHSAGNHRCTLRAVSKGDPLAEGKEMTTNKNLRTRKTEGLFPDNEKRLIQEALGTKALGGSIVQEKVSCGKTSCRVCGGSRLAHGPYNYLHYYDRSCGKVKRKYLSQALRDLLSCPKRGLEQRLESLSQEKGIGEGEV